MLYNTLHNRWLRLIVAVVGEFIAAVAFNLFIVPLDLYGGGLMGICQLLRTLLQTYGGLDFGSYDFAGILYFILNIPILLYSCRILGRALAFKTIICTVSYSVFYSIIPIPETPIVSDYLTACLVGGILLGIGSGLVLTCGCSGGGLDLVGLCLSKQGSTFTVGRFSLTFNAFLYGAFLVLFNPEVTIYSLIFNFFSSTMVDRMHKQNVNVQAMIFTHGDYEKLGQFITTQLSRGVTFWTGTGAYTGEEVHVLCVCLSKYEIEELTHVVHTIDPLAFLTVQEGTRVYGKFNKRLD